jgi:hypothetical protein
MIFGISLKNPAMKTIRLIFLISAISGILLTACKKNEGPTPEGLPKTLNELKASDTFNWTTGMPVEISITGLPTLAPVRSTLTIGLVNGTTLFSKLHLMDQNMTINLTIPSTEKELILKYGSVIYHVAVANNKAVFSFIPVLAEK